MDVTSNKKKLDTDDYVFLNSVKLSLYGALLREVIPSLRAIYFNWAPDTSIVIIDFYHDGKITDAIQSHYSSIIAEASGDQWLYKAKPIDCDFNIIHLEYPKPLPKTGYVITAYARKEPFVDPE